MVDSSAQRSARSSFSHIGRERGFVRWGIRSRYVALSLMKLTSLRNRCSALNFVSCATTGFFMRFTTDNFDSQSAVDIFNRVTGMWSTAQLSMKRRAMGATSVGNVALFAGGGVADGTCVMVVAGYVVECLSFDRMCLQQQHAKSYFCHLLLSHSSGSSHTAGVKSNVVDLYNVTAGTWSTVELSVARRNLAATTVRNLALFAGGFGPGGMFFFVLLHGLIV